MSSKIGKKYYFKVAAINDLCIQYQAEASTTRVAAGEASTSTYIQYGHAQFIKIRNQTNTAWVYPINATTLQPTFAYIKNSTNTMVNGEINIKDASGNWILN